MEQSGLKKLASQHRKFVIAGLLLATFPLWGNVLATKFNDVFVRNSLGIGAGPAVIGAPASSATPDTILDIQSSAEAVRLPQLNTTARNALTGASGMVIWNTTTGRFEYFDGSVWQPFSNSPYDSSTKTANLGLSVTSPSTNNLQITLTQKDGSTPTADSPVSVGFVSSSTPGQYNQVLVTSATSVFVQSGDTLGCGNTSCTIYVYLMNNSGTAQIAVSQSLLDESIPVGSALVGSGFATNAFTLYSNPNISPAHIRLIGRIDGAWTGSGWQVPSNVSLTPFYDGKVIGSANVVTKFGAAHIGTGGPSPTLDSNYQGMIASVSRTVGGTAVFTITGGYFSNIPVCQCSVGTTTVQGGSSCNIVALSSSSVSVFVGYADGSGVTIPANDGIYLSCSGPG